MPFGQLFQLPAHHPAGAANSSVTDHGHRLPSLPCVRSSAADAAPFLSPVAYGSRRPNLAAGSLDAPPFASTLAYASGIPPALHWVIIVFFSLVRLFLSVRYW